MEDCNKMPEGYDPAREAMLRGICDRIIAATTPEELKASEIELYEFFTGTPAGITT
jgi:hypothetical protein